MKTFLLLTISLSLFPIVYGQEASIQQQEDLWTVAWSPDGQYIATGGKAEYRNIRWSPDGDKLVSASEAMRISSKEGELLRTLAY